MTRQAAFNRPRIRMLIALIALLAMVLIGLTLSANASKDSVTLALGTSSSESR